MHHDEKLRVLYLCINGQNSMTCRRIHLVTEPYHLIIYTRLPEEGRQGADEVEAEEGWR
jgi:hypothetical protein